MANVNLPTLESKRVMLRFGAETDLSSILDYHRRNEEHLRPWSPRFPENFFTHGYWKERIKRNVDEFYAGSSCRFFLFPAQDVERVIGTVNFSNIVRGVFHACYLGYTLDSEYEGEGYMVESLAKGISFAFDDLNLHRIMANYIPRNQRSARVLAKLGFEIEGQAKNYLRINGAWEDHVLTSLTNYSWRDD